MKLRVLTGIGYFVVVTAFILLKILISDLFFDALIYACTLIGTFEIVRAFNGKLTKAESWSVYIFSGVCIPLTALAEEFFGWGALACAGCFFLLGIALLSLLVFRYEETTVENLGVAFVSAVYPTLLSALLILTNHLQATAAVEKFAFDSNLAILLIFVISPVSDTTAFFFGKFFRKKFPKKMAQSISPNKTVIGGIGGIVGGVVGGVLVYFGYNALFGSFQDLGLWLSVYAALGAVAAITNAFGDLVESAIKRKVGIKDMGKLLPGHGGILDRIDGTLFANVAVYLVFVLILAIV